MYTQVFQHMLTTLCTLSTRTGTRPCVSRAPKALGRGISGDRCQTMESSSGVLPAFIACMNQRGMRPRPDHVSDAFSG
jgi:hypothetical protein